MGLTVDVVLPVMNGRDLTERCLEHLGAQSLGHEVLLVDNVSTDGTTAMVRSRFPHVQVLELTENLGFGPACNLATRHGRGDILLFLNNDAFLRPDFLERLVTVFEAEPRVGSAAPLLVGPDEQAIDGVGITIDRTLASYARLRGQPVAEAGRTAPGLAGPGVGADAYRRRAFEEVNGFDEQLAFYFGDTELALRLARAGWTAAAATDAVAVHLRSSTLGHRSSLSRANGGFGRGYMLRRYGVLRRAPLRTIATETLVVCADSLLKRDLVSLRSRVQGWKAARGLPRLEWAPEAIDRKLSFAQSLRLRWSVR